MVLLRRVAFVSVALLLGVVASFEGSAQGSTPDIALIDFPSTIKTTDAPTVGRVYFKDPGQDVVRAEFDVVRAERFEPFSLDVSNSVQTGGTLDFFEFKLASTTAQRVELALTLVDAQQLRSKPRRLSFEVLGTSNASPAQAPDSRLQASPTRLTFGAQLDAAAPAAQTLNVSARPSETFFWNARANVSWIQLRPASGSSATAVVVSVNVAGLTPGRHTGEIALVSDAFVNSPLIVPVILNVSAASPAFPTSDQATPSTPPTERVSATQLLLLTFVRVDFVTPLDWRTTLENGCLVHTNLSNGARVVRVTLSDGSQQAFSVPAQQRVAACGNAVLIDTRLP